MSVRRPPRTRPCAKCRTAVSFDLLPFHDHQPAITNRWAIRFWCTDCLVRGGHLHRSTAAAIHRRLAAKAAEAAAEAEVTAALARRDALVESMLDKLENDEDFAYAFGRVLTYHHQATDAARAARREDGRLNVRALVIDEDADEEDADDHAFSVDTAA